MIRALDHVATLGCELLRQACMLQRFGPDLVETTEGTLRLWASTNAAGLCESALPWDERERLLRAALLEWLGSVAESAAYGELEPDEDDDDDDWDARAVDACRAIRPDLYARVAPFLDDADSSVRRAAVGAATHLLLAPELAERRVE